MSHFSEVKTNLKDRTILQKTLTEMGFTIEENEAGVEVRGFMGEKQSAEFKILTRTHYDIGFRQGVDGNYEVVGDWELLPRVSGIERELFTNKLKREYAKTAITETAKARGFDVECVEDEETGELQMMVTQW